MMTLFDDSAAPQRNLLPQDGMVQYYGAVFKHDEANLYYQQLLEQLAWEHDQAVIFGKHISTKRKVAWYGDQTFEYTYSGILKRALPWVAPLQSIKQQIEELCGARFNSCLCNLYHDGSEGMAWHSDGEKDLKKHGAIASVTFGAQRKFGFKHKLNKKTVYVELEHGSLLIMRDQTQDHWLHRLPPTTKVTTPRINLTFRTIEGSESSR
ncbi:alpha-ketoglutarate-dependent dioxygenase AlkB family protein [Sphingobacterium bambusae]|uniref:Alpha-ketoglutarate-dependent dioxygenase AlkB family protein n=1 Tax=Sphingobacterium bambusae TaxID=662858 RepID=A0ABW6BDP7_9SPHI|nr:alpha-ketoglutarate-dependent dioxygenase AlkB [Sphingobacterium bambusae]WPL47415.1 alpha-ketoglutarate-dependent dioxygenase AlkB [Sphingobacterium bambusae]